MKKDKNMKDENLNTEEVGNLATPEKESTKKTPKVKKEKKSKKASKMPEGYIGRPKPMKMKKEFHKPTKKFYNIK